MRALHFEPDSSSIRGLIRTLGLGCDAGQVPSRAVIPVHQRRVLRHAIVPHDYGARRPLDTDMEVGPDRDVVVQDLEEPIRFLLLETLNLSRDWSPPVSSGVLGSWNGFVTYTGD